MISFNESEKLCESHFKQLGDTWHIWTPENFNLLFPDTESFKTGMNLVGICSKLFPDIIVITFEVMSNHFHGTLSGEQERILRFFKELKHFLGRKLPVDLSNWDCSIRKVETLKDARNVVCYNNRNGFIVDENVSPYSYPWGANRYYFNPEAKARYYSNSISFGFNERRKACASHKADSINDLKQLDGYVSPMSFCDIESGEKLFRNASHYFNEISRNIESQKKIAQEIGERIFYTDNELFRVVMAMCNDKYNIPRPALLPKDAKLEIAKILHYDYNAGNKQIQRMLSLDTLVVNALFPR